MIYHDSPKGNRLTFPKSSGDIRKLPIVESHSSTQNGIIVDSQISLNINLVENSKNSTRSTQI
jgi:hypothetical protein